MSQFLEASHALRGGDHPLGGPGGGGGSVSDGLRGGARAAAAPLMKGWRAVKEKAQFWCAIIAVAGAVAITGVAVVVDVYRGDKSELTLLLAGGLLSLGSASAGWLFRETGTKDAG